MACCAVYHPPTLIFRHTGFAGSPALSSLNCRGWPPPSEADLAPAFLHREREDKYFF